MKKIISAILLLGLTASLSACGGEKITMQEIYDASNVSAMLEKHESVYIKNAESGVVYEESYEDKDYKYSLYGGEYYGTPDLAFLTTDNASYSYSDGNYTRAILLSKEGLVDNYREEDNDINILGMETVDQTIQSVTKKDDRITVVSYQVQENNDPSDYRLDCEYVLDAQTRELISSRCVYTYSDGTVYDIGSEFFYDAEIPEGMKTFLEYDQQIEDLRTITIVSHPGTENEKSENVRVPKGLMISVESNLYDEGNFTMYADAACTEPFAFSEDNNSDATIYVKWDE